MNFIQINTYLSSDVEIYISIVYKSKSNQTFWVPKKSVINILRKKLAQRKQQTLNVRSLKITFRLSIANLSFWWKFQVSTTFSLWITANKQNPFTENHCSVSFTFSFQLFPCNFSIKKIYDRWLMTFHKYLLYPIWYQKPLVMLKIWIFFLPEIVYLYLHRLKK